MYSRVKDGACHGVLESTSDVGFVKASNVPRRSADRWEASGGIAQLGQKSREEGSSSDEAQEKTNVPRVSHNKKIEQGILKFRVA